MNLQLVELLEESQQILSQRKVFVASSISIGLNCGGMDAVGGGAAVADGNYC